MKLETLSTTKVELTIDNKTVSTKPGSTILEAARGAGIEIPTLCYLKDLNEIAACRICCVEVEGQERLVPACSSLAEPGLVIRTNSPKVRAARRVNLQLILSQHDTSCTTCTRNKNCRLQDLSDDLGLVDNPYEVSLPRTGWNSEFPLIRDAARCIQCMRCIQVCDQIQDLHIWDLTGSGSRAAVSVAKRLPIEETACSLCGQCVTHCPVGALSERDDTLEVIRALGDPDTVTVVQLAPAVRTAWAEGLGIDRSFASVNRLVAALREMGFDYIFDTNFAADLTIMEEGSELIGKLQEGHDQKLPEGHYHKPPLFTSCCPGWVRFVKSQYPELAGNLSTAKSPQQMFGAIAKTYYARLLGIDPSRLYVVSIMPCIAKKDEARLPGMDAGGTGPEVDAVLTTREITRMIKAEHINVALLEEEAFDQPLGCSSGAGVIFGTTGGVMEAALRSAAYLLTGENPDPDAFRDVRGRDGWKEAGFDLAGRELKVAVVSGLGNTRRLMEALLNGTAAYDFVEVMACPGGCTGGGGQPIHEGRELAFERGQVLYGLDKRSDIRFSHENPAVQQVYADFLGEPLSAKAHELLHV